MQHVGSADLVSQAPGALGRLCTAYITSEAGVSVVGAPPYGVPDAPYTYSRRCVAPAKGPPPPELSAGCLPEAP
jgi:hypothetical protein